jgi:outer membrane protein assembly factor BamB
VFDVVALVCLCALLTVGPPVSAAPLGGIDWPSYGFDVQRTGENPGEVGIGVGNAGQLHEVWTADLGAVMVAQPVEATGVNVGDGTLDLVYEGTEHGDVVALDAAGGATVWNRNLGSVKTGCLDIPDGVFGVGGTPAVDRSRGVLYVPGGDGAVHALDLSTGDESPGWPIRGVFDPNHEHVYGGLTLFDGELYVTTAGLCDDPPFHGRLLQIDVGSRRITRTFYPAGRKVNGGGIWGPGGASVDPATGHVFLSTGNALTSPQWYRYAEHVIELSPTLKVLGANAPRVKGEDADFGSTPTVFTPAGCPEEIAAMNKYGVLVVYEVGAVDAGPIQRLQIASQRDWRFIGMPAFSSATNMLYIGNSSDSNAGYKHGLVALQVQSDCTLSLAWQQSVGTNKSIMSPPTVAGDVVYFGDGPNNTEFAFDASTGAQLWDSGITIGGRVVVAPTVVNGMLLVTSWDHHLHSFQP